MEHYVQYEYVQHFQMPNENIIQEKKKVSFKLFNGVAQLAPRLSLQKVSILKRL